MPRRTSARVAAPLVVMAALIAACRVDRTPRRVPGDGAPCSALMPGPPESSERTFRFETVTVSEHTWMLRPREASDDSPPDVTTYLLRRAMLPAGSGLRDAPLLEAAAKRVARGLELRAGDGTKPTVAKVSTPSGSAVDLRWAAGPLHNATRLLSIPGGYCEATIMGARSEADVASYLASVQARPDAKP